MKKQYAWVAALALLGGVWSMAQAQSLPKPKEFYFDEDRATTKPVVAVQGQGDAVVDRLAGMVQRDARAAEPRAQLAALAYAGGRTQLGDELYQGALALVSNGSQQYRAISWNYGWDLLRADKADKALQHWANLANGRPATPAWLPTTLALGLWRAPGRTVGAAPPTTPACCRSGARQTAPAWPKSSPPGRPTRPRSRKPTARGSESAARG